MSGRKHATLSLSAEDRRKLESIQERLKEVEEDYAAARKRLQDLRLEEIQRSQQEMEERQAGFSHALQDVHVDSAAQVAELESQLSQALLSYSFHWQQQLAQAEDAGRQAAADHAAVQSHAWQQSFDQLQTLLDQQAQAFQTLWTQAQAERQAHFEARRRQARQLQNARQRKAWLAEQAYNEALVLWQALDRQYDHEHLAPGALVQYQAEIDAAAFNLQNEMHEAALSLSQQAQIALVRLRLHMEATIARRSALAAETLAQALHLCDLAQSCAETPALDLDGQSLDVMVDVNAWAEGRQQQLAAEVVYLYQQLEEQAPYLDEAQWQQALEQELPRLEDDLRETVRQARQNVIASEVRYNVAQQVVEALSEQGFMLQDDAGYQGDDPRRPYQATLTSLDGSEVQVRVLAEGRDPLNYVLDIDSCDQEQRSEHELVQRTREVLGSLESAGLQVTGIYRVEGLPPPAPRRSRARRSQPARQS